MDQPATFTNIAALNAWAIAQIIKVHLEFIRLKRWNWSLLLRAEGGYFKIGIPEVFSAFTYFEATHP